MNTEDRDYILVSARIYEETPSGPEVFWTSPTVTISPMTSEGRTDQLEVALSSYLDYVSDLERDGEMEIFITFCPVSGQAGVVFTPEMLQRLTAMNVRLYVDALGS